MRLVPRDSSHPSRGGRSPILQASCQITAFRVQTERNLTRATLIYAQKLEEVCVLMIMIQAIIYQCCGVLVLSSVHKAQLF